MINFTKISLAKKLTLLTIALSFITSFTILFMVNFSLNHFNEIYLSDVLSSSKKTIEQVYMEPLWNFDQLQIAEVSKSLMINNGFAYITAIKVTKPSGEVIYYNNLSTKKLSSFQEYLKLPYTRFGTVKIFKRDQWLGTVDIVFTNSGFIEKFKNILFSFFIITVFIILISSAWIFISFNKYLSIPLNQLLVQVQKLKNEDYSLNVYENLPHELLLIANALNFTSNQIKIRNEELKNHSDNLEKTIELRTKELELQISENINAQRLAAVGELASGIAHEINNPLTVILGCVSRIKRHSNANSEDLILMDNLDKLVHMTGRITKIIKGLKSISRDGAFDPMKTFMIQPMIEELKILTDIKILALGIKFTVDIDPTVESAFGREVQISQVLVNLVNNSIDAIESFENQWIKIEIRDQGEMVKFIVTDSGAGIPKHLVEKIMYPFFTTKDVGKGTGLGLSVSKGIVEEHDGIMLYNENCKNTQFIFTLHKSAFNK